MATRTLVLFATLLATGPFASAAGLDDGPSEVAPGTACPGCEGEWNCLDHAYQRCASGRWSTVRPLACGTLCTPAGRSYDFSLVPDQEDPTTVCSSAMTASTTASTTATANSSYTSSISSSTPSSASAPVGFTGGSAATPLGPVSLTQNGCKQMTAAVVGIGAAAVVFAQLLM